MVQETQNKIIISIAILMLYILSVMSFASAILVDVGYITIYPGENGDVKITVENNENFDIEDVSVELILATSTPTGGIVSLPFSVIGSSQEGLDNLNEDDDDSATFTIKAATDITPGDYNIPYVVRYTNQDNNDSEKKEGTFGIRISAKTDLDFGVDSKGDTTTAAIIGQKGRISLEIINKGLGDLRSVSVEVTPNGYDLLSKNKVFVGTVNAEDSDVISFDVLFKSKNAKLDAIVTYKDFDNKDQTETVSLQVKNIYTNEEALNAGIIQKSRTGIYIGVVVVVIILWFVYRSIRKRQKQKKREQERETRR